MFGGFMQGGNFPMMSHQAMGQQQPWQINPALFQQQAMAANFMNQAAAAAAAGVSAPTGTTMPGAANNAGADATDQATAPTSTPGHGPPSAGSNAEKSQAPVSAAV